MNKKIIIGVDEAGRGPLAGPVYSAAVVLSENFDLSYLNDSKKLSAIKREEAKKYILKNASYYSISSVSSEMIDEINILNATLLSMEKAVEEVLKKINHSTDNILILIDGNKTINTSYECKAIIKGDSKIPEIMAASILAKTERDKFMIEMDKIYPLYGFKKHKGYGTKEHYEAIKKYGVCPLHRKTFRLH